MRHRPQRWRDRYYATIELSHGLSVCTTSLSKDMVAELLSLSVKLSEETKAV